MFCPECGNPAPDKARFCPTCGEKLEEVTHLSSAVEPYEPVKSTRRRWLLGVLLALLILAAVSVSVVVALRRPAPSASSHEGFFVSGIGFQTTLPTGYIASAPITTGGLTGYDITSVEPTITGQIEIASLIGPTPIPGQTSGAQLEALDIKSLALITGAAKPGTTNARYVENIHTRTVAGETCAQFGTVSTLQGSTSANLYMACRHNHVLYAVLYGGGLSIGALDDLLSATLRDWRWT